jgi:hypothetical protein
MLCFVIRMRRQFSGAGATNPRTIPTVRIDLYEAGVFRKLLGWRAVTATSGQILIFPFSVADLTVPSGADIELVLNCTPGISVSGGSYAQLDTVSLYYESVVWIVDSGWTTFQADTRPAPFYAPRYLHYFPSSAWSGVTGYTVMVRSDQTVHNPPLDNLNDQVPEGSIATPVTYIEAGVSAAGVVARPEVGIVRGSGPATRVDVLEFSGATAGGQSFGADSLRRIISEPLEMIVTRDELKLLQDQLAYRRGRSGGIYVAMEPGVDAIYQSQTAFWCTLKELSAPTAHGRYRSDGSMRYKVTVSFAEKL